MTGCPVSWKCRVACLPTDESQQPTWPQIRHSRSSTQRVPSRRHSSHAAGVLGGGKSAPVNPPRCSHSSLMVFSFHRVHPVGERLQPKSTPDNICPTSTPVAFEEFLVVSSIRIHFEDDFRFDRRTKWKTRDTKAEA